MTRELWILKIVKPCLMATAAGNLDLADYYLWATYFVVP